MQKDKDVLTTELYGADETCGQGISLKIDDYKHVEVTAWANAATTFRVEYSYDNTHWFTLYQSPAPETFYSNLVAIGRYWNTSALYIRLSGAAAGVAGNRMHLVIAAKY